MAPVIHWRLCKKFSFESEDKWYNHVPKLVLESSQSKILWDFKIQIGQTLQYFRRKPRERKIEKYQDLKRELQRTRKCKDIYQDYTIIGALGNLPRGVQKWLSELDMASNIQILQKACLLRTVLDRRKVLNT